MSSLSVPGVTVLGLLGEANKLSRSESLAIVKRVARRADGRFKIIVGASQAGFAELKSFTTEAVGEGAAGFMVPPASNLKTEDQIVIYFKAVAACIGADVLSHSRTIRKAPESSFPRIHLDGSSPRFRTSSS
jgi:4-hydroxy-tetrahydrodipicolinate synthase